MSTFANLQHGGLYSRVIFGLLKTLSFRETVKGTANSFTVSVVEPNPS
jgi:hypothetical protein